MPAEITYGLERIVAFLQNVESVYDIEWAPGLKYADVRLADEEQFSTYNFEMADVDGYGSSFELHEAECQRLLRAFAKTEDTARFPVLAAYDQALKCSNLFNLLDARGAISVTERVAVIARVRKLAVGVARLGWRSRVRPKWRLPRLADFLLEIGAEEIPDWMIDAGLADLRD